MRLTPALLLLLAGCAAPKPAPRPYADPGPFCTRTLGVPECFATPSALPDHPAGLGDTPVRLPQDGPGLLQRLAHDWHQEE